VENHAARLGSTQLHRVVRRPLEREGAARSSLAKVAALLARQVPENPLLNDRPSTRRGITR
jgi:hypothetical protein